MPNAARKSNAHSGTRPTYRMAHRRLMRDLCAAFAYTHHSIKATPYLGRYVTLWDTRFNHKAPYRHVPYYLYC